ncbi:MAG: tRNA (N6-threonylcarbamoyladenosine(37)-N6)-methyltransferase TrmO [Euryarchaeota archaeon]|nr:tRNA (N6-threonylcarbamoyladenosine(37)-N6)-methyltransferase TrmO [Euryarchaeota archaeon]
MKQFKLYPIGIIRSPYKKQSEAPRQGRDSDKLSEIIIFDECAEGLRDLERYSHLIVLYWLDRANRNQLTAIPPGKVKERGVFSTRSPNRPNPIALCLAEIIRIENTIITVKGLDALDKTPLLDIKPYIFEIDCVRD